SLVSLGLLRSMATRTFQNRAPRAHRPGPGEPEGSPPLDTVAIVTADRPRVLARALHALGLDRTTSIDVIIVDGSREQSSATRVVVEEAGKSAGIHTTYIGEADAAALRQRLAAAHIPLHVLEAALTPGGIGSGR